MIKLVLESVNSDASLTFKTIAPRVLTLECRSPSDSPYLLIYHLSPGDCGKIAKVISTFLKDTP